MSAHPSLRLTPEEYLALERKSEHKSEYFNGEMFAMTGASEPHNLIAGNVFASLHFQLRTRQCKVYPSDMRVKVGPVGLYTYPDVTVVCGEARFDDAQKDTLTNPTIIVEVLSASTEGYDRGKKFEHYRKLESLAEYFLFAENDPNDRTKVETYFSDFRSVNGAWVPFHQTTYEDGKVAEDLVLASVAFNVGVSDTEFALPTEVADVQ